MEASKKKCEKCGKDADPIFHMADGATLKGWFCPYCGHFDKAIQRERNMEMEVKK